MVEASPAIADIPHGAIAIDDSIIRAEAAETPIGNIDRSH
jgi:hypothetical protein